MGIKKTLASACVGALLLIGLTTRANAAALTYTDLNVQVVTKTVNLPKGASTLTKVECPAGTKILTGGAYIRTASVDAADLQWADDAHVAASYPLTSSTWLATAHNATGPPDLQLTTIVKCTDAFLEDAVVRGTTRVGRRASALAQAPCSMGQQIYAAGAWMSRSKRVRPPTAADAKSSWVSGAKAEVAVGTPDPPIYYGKGFATKQIQWLHVVAYCSAVLPHFQVAGIRNLGAGSPSGGYAVCPDGTRAISGGTMWFDSSNEDAKDFNKRARLSSSAPTGDGTAWYGDGSAVRDTSINEQIYQDVQAYCIPA